MILIDTGPLVALFDPKDHDHADCLATLHSVNNEPMYTTEAVLTEVFHMLRHGSKGFHAFKDFVMEGYVTMVSLDSQMLARCFELMHRYEGIAMDFADATLLSVAEKFKTNRVFTLDFKDFRTYQFKKGHRYYSLDLMGSELLEK
jgi:predicted nucleic acid-binding protein